MLANLEYYKVFYHVVKYGSVTQAAQQLSISQPAASQSVRQLEEVLGAKLFYRTPHGLRPTAEGQLLYFYIEKGYEQFEQGEKRLFQQMNLERGEIHIGASDMTLRFFLLPYLEKFHEAYPNIKISVTNVPTPAALRLLHEEKIDFAVVSGPLLKEEGIRQRPVRVIEDVIVAGKKFSAYADRKLPLKTLEELPLITMEPDTSTRRYMQRFWEEHGIEIRPEFELATSDMIVQFSLRNLGVGSVVKDFAEEFLASGELKVLEFEPAMPPRHLLVVTDEQHLANVAAQKLLAMIEQETAGVFQKEWGPQGN